MEDAYDPDWPEKLGVTWEQLSFPEVPAQPKRQPWSPQPLFPPPDPQCSACGLVLKPVMGYVCNRVPCPPSPPGRAC